MFAIVKHKAVDALRRLRSQRWAQEKHWEAALLAAEEPAPDALERSRDSGRLLEKLSVPDREALRLTRIEGLSTAEAAARLHIFEGALKVRTHRAIGRLARLLETDTT